MIARTLSLKSINMNVQKYSWEVSVTAQKGKQKVNAVTSMQDDEGDAVY